MLLYLFPDAFTGKIKKANYAYYLDRTLHKSSLSLPSHANIAIEIGDKNRAYSFFNTALRTDISNVNNNIPTVQLVETMPLVLLWHCDGVIVKVDKDVQEIQASVIIGATNMRTKRGSYSIPLKVT